MQVNLIRNTLQSNQDGRPIIRPLRVEFLAVAGGGGGSRNSTSPGDASFWGNGGGAGGLITGSFCAEKFTDYPIVVGGGGAPVQSGVNPTATNGEDTTLFGVTAIGGGAGGATGVNGGSGGGGQSGAGIGLQPAATYAGFGNNGSDNNASGSAGGGAGSAASGQLGGAPLSLDFTGTDVLYAGGGNGYEHNTAQLPVTASIGRGGDGGFSSDVGTYPSRLATSGSNGIVVIKYYGAPKATGGTITQSNGITYHTFTSGSVVNFVVTKNEDNFALNNCNDGTTV